MAGVTIAKRLGNLPPAVPVFGGVVRPSTRRAENLWSMVGIVVFFVP